MRTPFRSAVEAMEMPRLVRLAPNLYGVVFELMKLLPASYLIDRARAGGELAPGAPVVETSSGTFGLGLAMVCRLRGHPLVVVGDAAIDHDLRIRLEMLGCRVELVEDTGGAGGVQQARLDRVERLRAESPGCFVPDQYGNPDNPAAYGTVSDLLRSSLERVDCVVGAVGSGGSTGGVTRGLRAHGDAVHLIGVDTQGSVLFGLPPAARPLRGLGSGILPPNVDHRAYDEVHWVPPGDAFATTRSLYAETGLFAGPTSGAAHLAARWWAAAHPDLTTVVLLPDQGYRYQRTVYSPTWLHENRFWRPDPPTAPVTVGHPDDVADRWSRIDWGRRDLIEVVARPATTATAHTAPASGNGRNGEDQRCGA